MPMRTDDLFHWAAIIVSPTIYLADLSLSYALVPWVCATGHAGTLHAVSAIGLLLIVAPLLIGWRLVHRRTAMNYASPIGARARFLTILAVASTLLFAFAMVLQWAAQFVIGPCVT